MKQFFKFFFASVFGTLTALLLAVIGFFIFVSIMVSVVSSEEAVSLSEKTVFELQLDYNIAERTSYERSNAFSLLLPGLVKQPGLKEIVDNIKKAKVDEDITGIYLNLNNFIAGSYVNVRTIREAVKDFKLSGKFVIAYGNRISQKAYYLASAADKIYLAPTGSLDARGLSMELTFFKKTLDMLEIEPQIFQAGKYKSAVETFDHEKMSAANSEQLNAYLNSIYDEIVNQIAHERKLNTIDLKNIFDEFKTNNIHDALNLGVIDGLKYYDQLIDTLKILSGVKQDESLKKVKLETYMNVPAANLTSSPNRIAVIYAVGEILEGNGNEDYIGLENITKELRKARKNKNVKAIVLRINSPGGSPLTSEQILREVQLTKGVKPIIVSFSGVAASGGYYIACAADEIVSDPFCITGSIGAFGILPNLNKFFDKKLGVTFDRVQTGKYGGLYSMVEPLSADEKKIIQSQIDGIYNDFTARVADGRSMSLDYVREIAQGRIYSGLQAIEIGLIDSIGGLQEAIDIAADRAEIKDYRIVEYPAVKEPFDKIMDLFTTEIFSPFSDFGSLKAEDIIRNVKNFISEKGLLTRMPFDVTIN